VIDPSEHGAKVIFRHLGFPDAQPEYEHGSINLTWGLVVARLKGGRRKRGEAESGAALIN
jgi:hypothetical protein